MFLPSRLRTLLVVVPATFILACGRDAVTDPAGPLATREGTVVVEIVRTGNGADADGFTVSAGAHTAAASFAQGGVLAGLTPGAHWVQLSGVARHCAAVADSVRVEVPSSGTATARFTVDCVGGIAWTRGWSWNDTLEYLGEDGRVVAIARGRDLIQVPREFSPDGRSLAWEEWDRAGGMRVAISRIDGSRPTAFTAPPPGWKDWAPAWSPDGQQVAFMRTADFVGGHVMLMNADGSDLRQLTFDRWSGLPAWSPDGSELAVSTSRYGWVDLVVLRRDGTEARRLTTLSAPDQIFNQVSWTSDGGEIGAYMQVGPRQGIGVVNAAGGPVRHLWTGPGIAFGFRWSPDGRQAAVLVTPGAEPGYSGPVTAALWVVNRDGSAPRELVPGLDVGPATWSGDGARLAFVKTHDGSDREVMIARPDGTGVRAITDAGPHGTPTWNRAARPGRGS